MKQFFQRRIRNEYIVARNDASCSIGVRAVDERYVSRCESPIGRGDRSEWGKASVVRYLLSVCLAADFGRFFLVEECTRGSVLM